MGGLDMIFFIPAGAAPVWALRTGSGTTCAIANKIANIARKDDAAALARDQPTGAHHP